MVVEPITFSMSSSKSHNSVILMWNIFYDATIFWSAIGDFFFFFFFHLASYIICDSCVRTYSAANCVDRLYIWPIDCESSSVFSLSITGYQGICRDLIRKLACGFNIFSFHPWLLNWIYIVEDFVQYPDFSSLFNISTFMANMVTGDHR